MKKPKGRRCSLDSYLGEPRPDPAPVLLRPTWAERKLIRKSWQKAESVVVDAGVDVFIKWVHIFSNYLNDKKIMKSETTRVEVLEDFSADRI